MPCVHRLASVIYAPFRDYIRQFGDYEDTSLTSALDAIPVVCFILIEFGLLVRLVHFLWHSNAIFHGMLLHFSWHSAS